MSVNWTETAVAQLQAIRDYLAATGPRVDVLAVIHAARLLPRTPPG